MNPVYTEDTATLEAAIYDQDGVEPVVPDSTSWEVVLPNSKTLTSPIVPLIGEVGDRVILTEADGGFAQYEVLAYSGTAWGSLSPPFAQKVDDQNATIFILPPAAVYLPGVYRARARFTLSDGSVRSELVQFEALDPMDQSTTNIEKTIDLAWMMLEDCFDSEIGGPYLRDATLAYFDKRKLALFADNALMAINLKPPAQNFDTETFPFDQARALLAKSLLIEGVKHLMRSYIEQPAVIGAGQISYFDRRDYLQRWQTIYQIEKEEFGHYLALFKRGYYNFGHGSLLIDMKSGRRQMYPQLDRARGRYWY